MFLNRRFTPVAHFKMLRLDGMKDIYIEPTDMGRYDSTLIDPKQKPLERGQDFFREAKRYDWQAGDYNTNAVLDAGDKRYEEANSAKYRNATLLDGDAIAYRKFYAENMPDYGLGPVVVNEAAGDFENIEPGLVY